MASLKDPLLSGGPLDFYQENTQENH